MSIQLLPKLFSSFQQFVSSGQGPHWVTAWASRELNMMDLFFNNITHFMESLRRGEVTNNSLYSPVEEVQARLQYLSSVFSCELSHQDFSKLRMVPGITLSQFFCIFVFTIILLLILFCVTSFEFVTVNFCCCGGVKKHYLCSN